MRPLDVDIAKSCFRARDCVSKMQVGRIYPITHFHPPSLKFDYLFQSPINFVVSVVYDSLSDMRTCGDGLPNLRLFHR